jgi:hypothetical protein
MLLEKILDTYSRLHSPITYSNHNSISFDGSQIQNEFFHTWDLITEFYEKNPKKEISFLEVGAWKGLWGLAFAEFCNIHGIKGKYVTITMVDQDPNNQSLYRSLEYIKSIGVEAHLINENTLSETSLNKVIDCGLNYNIVFIDADHSYNAVMSDIKKFSPLATDLLLFHDIRPKEVSEGFGVYKAIEDSNIQLDEEIVSIETTMGIGIKYVNKK